MGLSFLLVYGGGYKSPLYLLVHVFVVRAVVIFFVVVMFVVAVMFVVVVVLETSWEV